MSSNDGHRTQGEQQPGGLDDAHADCLPQEVGSAVLGPAVADSGYAGVEVASGVLGRLEGEDFVWEGCEVVARSSVADADQVYMRVDETWENGAAAVVEDVDGGVCRGKDGVLGADAYDDASLDEDSRALDGGSACSVDEAGGLDEGEAVLVGVSHWRGFSS